MENDKRKDKPVRRKIFKIESKRLKRAKWDLGLSMNVAIKMEEVVALGDSQLFRWIDLIRKGKNKGEFQKDVVAIIFNTKSDYDRACGRKGFKINGIKYKRLLGTTGGIKKNTVLFINEDIYDDIYNRIENGRNKDVKLVPSKYEAYKALACSSSFPVSDPNGVLVVKDAITKFKDKVIYISSELGEGKEEVRPKIEYIDDYEVELNTNDGFGLCTPELMDRWQHDLKLDYKLSGVCIRNAFTKGMVYPFDIVEWATEHSDTYMVTDIWGEEKDIREVELVLTESMLKLWSSYDSVDNYLSNCKKNNYSFAVTKFPHEHLEDTRCLNYQYLQSYELCDDDIAELCKPTVEWLKGSLCGDYEHTMEFLGCDDLEIDDKDFSFVKALKVSDKMMDDPFVIYKLNRLIKKKIDEAKIGKLKVNANYQISSGDPIILMESMFGMELKGLLGRGEFYSKYWIDNGDEEVLLFRSPMTSHNNIIKAKLKNNDECEKWYKHMDKHIIFNGWDCSTHSLNGQDHDSDSNYITNCKVLLDRYQPTRPIICMESSSSKQIVTDENIMLSNKNGFGNAVGTITNRITSMFDVMANFDKDSPEYKELSYRILCGQLFQQSEIDKIKTGFSVPMPKSWYDYNSCKDDFNRSICADKKGRFMTYIYPREKAEYNKYIKDSNRKCIRMFGKSIEELEYQLENTEAELQFLEFYYSKMTVGLGDCTMNKICKYIEGQFDGYVKDLTSKGFNVELLKSDATYTTKQYNTVKKVCDEYRDERTKRQKEAKTGIRKNQGFDKKYSNDLFVNTYMEKFKAKCENQYELTNILIDMCYGDNLSKQVVWDICEETLLENLRRNSCGENHNE